MSDERTLEMLQAAVLALPSAPTRAAQVFALLTEDEPGMADAWLGRVATGDKSLATLETLARLSLGIGNDLGALRLVPQSLGAVFDTDYVRLPITDADSARLAYTAALISAGQYHAAEAQLRDLRPSGPVNYLRAVLSRHGERWPDVLTAVADCGQWFDVTLRRAGAMVEALAAANLGLDDRALAAAQRAELEDSSDEITRDARFCRALVLRHQGEGESAQALLTEIRVRWPDFVPAQSALADSTYGHNITDQATIDSRTDKWDTSTATTAEQREAEEHASSARELLAEADAQLQAMVGLGAVKRRIEKLKADSIARTLRKRRGLPTTAVSRHLLMVGPPGVGKTVSARVIANMFCGLGILRKPDLFETKKSNLTGRHLGDAEVNTLEFLQKALGATVFIDEFGDLVGRGYLQGDAYGEAIIATLVPWMENERANTVIIAAGYPRASARVLATNDGLQSRFSTIIEYNSYNPDELIAIGEVVATESGHRLEPGAMDRVLREPFTNYYNRDHINEDGDVIREIDILGNGRFVRSIIERADEARNERVISGHGLAQLDLSDELAGADVPDDDLMYLTAEDLHAGWLDALPPAMRQQAGNGETPR